MGSRSIGGKVILSHFRLYILKTYWSKVKSDLGRCSRWITPKKEIKAETLRKLQVM